MGSWQRAQLEGIRIDADVVFASIDAWAQTLRRRRPSRATFHLPVGSNLPDKLAARAQMRHQLGPAEGSLVLAAFGTANPSRRLDYIVGAANALARLGTPVVVLNLGSDAPKLASLDGRIRLYEPGPLPDDKVASLLAAADIFLAPFVDGVSTRRGSMMAALQQGLPIVGTLGVLTDGALKDEADALRLVPVNRPDAFVEAVLELARDAEERLRVGNAGRALYESSFDWPVLAERLLGLLATAAARSA
jgi:glycosyltransferase involved in cell wall biosynthesis